MEKKTPTPEFLREFLAAWGDKFFALPQYPMEPTVAKCYVNCCLSESDPNFPSEGLRKSFSYEVASKRAASINLSVTPAVLTMLCVLARSPGIIVMYLYALKHFQIRENIGVINTSVFSLAFPMGFPDDASMSSLWDDQKGFSHGFTCDNLLDRISEGILA